MPRKCCRYGNIYGPGNHRVKDPKCKNQKGLIKFCCASNQDLLEPEPTYLHQVISKYTRYDNKFVRSSAVPCNNIMVRKNFEKIYTTLDRVKNIVIGMSSQMKTNNQDFPTIFLLLEIVIWNSKICTMV